MRLIIEARLEGDAGTADTPVMLAAIEREDHNLTDFGLSLAEGRQLLAAAQSALATRQAATWLRAQTSCPRCRLPLRHKDSRRIFVRTVFGKVAVASPRLWSCPCAGAAPRSVSLLSRALARRVTPELEYLQVKWAAHLSFATATALLKEVLPVQDSVSASGAKDRIRAVGKALDARIEQEIATNAARLKVEAVVPPQESARVTALGVDSA